MVLIQRATRNVEGQELLPVVHGADAATTKGVMVRTMGTKRATMIVFTPYFSK
ncbi:MAG: hypothetical protein IPN85_14525 [Flavobacteriales bacterium]|nr:hypothetical protein [Flavobacteriales bacterium]